jgi:hypothetical protein
VAAIAIATPAAIMLYSMAVAPFSLTAKRTKSFVSGGVLIKMTRVFEVELINKDEGHAVAPA